MIKSHPNWLFAGVFYDIESGLRRSGRKSLDKLLRRAEKGKIDYIITKSISKVSRDTLKVLKIIRFLRERGINMHFENEKLTQFAERLIVEGLNGARLSGAARQGLKKAERHTPTPLLWMKGGYRILWALLSARTELMMKAC